MSDTTNLKIQPTDGDLLVSIDGKAYLFPKGTGEVYKDIEKELYSRIEALVKANINKKITVSESAVVDE
jgi:Mor family transcriptional regulator